MTPARCEALVAAHWHSDGAHDLGHLRRVWASAQAIAKAEGGADVQILLAASYFHDIVNLPKDSPDRAAASRLSADLAVQILRDDGFDATKLPGLHHAIHAHSFSAAIPPQTLEARILQDADRLEALGAIGMARMFLVAGAMGAALFDPEDPLATARPLNDRCFALDHMEVKLFPVAAGIQTATGRAMAQARVAFMQAYRDQLLREIG